MGATSGPVLVLIGAGSAVFTPGLLHDLAGSPVFADAQQELVVDAAVSGSRSLALQALTLDPLVPDAATAGAILDDAVAADRDRLGRFAAP